MATRLRVPVWFKVCFDICSDIQFQKTKQNQKVQIWTGGISQTTQIFFRMFTEYFTWHAWPGSQDRPDVAWVTRKTGMKIYVLPVMSAARQISDEQHKLCQIMSIVTTQKTGHLQRASYGMIR